MHSTAQIERKAELLVILFKERELMIATAESCTGGLIGGTITDISGSSAVLDRGFITYSNEAKQEMLQVPGHLIADFGAVSQPVAEAMAIGALENSRAQVSIAVTGVAGPGASENKPAGMVYIACALKGSDDVTVALHHFKGDRATVRLETVHTALQLAIDCVEQQEDTQLNLPLQM